MSGTTKQKIMDAALALFSERGYEAVSVGQIAQAVGIKAPSLYKHYPSKEAIRQAILEAMAEGYRAKAAALHIDGTDPGADAAVFSTVSEDSLVQMGKELFSYFLHDGYTKKFRKMLTLEQYSNPDSAAFYTRQYWEDPLSYQSAMLGLLAKAGLFRQADPKLMALQFYAPLYALLLLCDRQPQKEAEAMVLLESHIRQFSRLYRKEETR